MIKKEKRLKEPIKDAMEYYGAATFGKQDKECEYVTGNRGRKDGKSKSVFQFESSCE